MSAPGPSNVPQLMQRIGFSIFFPQRDTLSHSKPPPRGGPPAGGLAGANLVTFAVRAQSCVRRSNVDTCVYVHVAPSNLDVNAACVRRSTVAARDTAICCATSTCTSRARRHARPARRSSNVSGRVRVLAALLAVIRLSQAPNHGHRPSPGATPGSLVPHAAGQAPPVRHRSEDCRADLYRRQGCFFARGVDLGLGWPSGTRPPAKRFSEFEFRLRRCLRIGSCHGG